jgi:seryl-tRNA synthetase
VFLHGSFETIFTLNERWTLSDQIGKLLRQQQTTVDDRVPHGRSDEDNEVVAIHGSIYTLPQRLGWPSKYCDNTSSTTSSTQVSDNNPTTDNADDTVEGTTKNGEEKEWKPAWHDDIATQVHGYMSDVAVLMSGARFVALRAEIAQLERAIGQWMIDLHTTEHGYIEVSVPYVVSRSTLIGTGQLPKFEEDLFAITPQSHTCNGEDAFLIPTAEVPITNLHRDQVLKEEDLPISYVALTPCFRAEAGSYGRDTKDLIRTHQFHKVELVKITSATTSVEQHELLTSHAEKYLQLLELPYRKVRLCSGDIGFSANHCYDLEVYLPGSQEYREISSCSNTGDFQSRRLALRYRPKPVDTTTATTNKKSSGGGKVKPILCHTINGSGLAVGRTLVAISMSRWEYCHTRRIASLYEREGHDP